MTLVKLVMQKLECSKIEMDYRLLFYADLFRIVLLSALDGS